MKTTKVIKIGDLAILLVAFFCTLLLPGVLQGANIPSVEDVVKGKAVIPTIEDLTGGKVKNNALIDKSNVELVKEYLPLGIYENVKGGMVLKMGTQQPPEKLNPKAFYEATERNRGKAVTDNKGVVYYEKIGIPWPGGYPFPWVNSGLEAMGNLTYGQIADNQHNYPVVFTYVNAKGEIYKTVVQDQIVIKCTGRTAVPPLGTIPGYEGILLRRVSGATYPLEIKGLGQYSNRYYDFMTIQDTGFAYLPAFKRTLRINANTWQDNIAGSDATYGDGNGGFAESPMNWSFKLLERKFILVTERKSPLPLVDATGATKNLQTDVGKKYPRVGWVVCPVDVVEGTPKIKHVYGKKVFYMPIYPYMSSIGLIAAVDIYDRQMKLWKAYLNETGSIKYIGGDPQKPMTPSEGIHLWDLQTGHSSLIWLNVNFDYVNPDDLNLGRLLKMGR